MLADEKNAPRPLGFLAGPTASGKSNLSVSIARAHNLSIISADSMQVYRGLEVGTGAILDHERQGVPHFLVATADAREEFHAARFVAEARRVLAEESARGRRCLVVGGTGMWIQALREGLFGGPGRDEGVRARLRERLAAEGSEALHGELARVDPPTAVKLHPRDHVRILRALEVFELSGRPLSAWYAEDQQRRAALGPLPPLVVLERPLPELHDRIDRRVDVMLAAGWVAEARALAALALPDHAPPKKALGYRELMAWLEEGNGEPGRGNGFRGSAQDLSPRAPKGADRESIPRSPFPVPPSVAASIKLATRQYARQQRTWFRSQRGVQFVPPEQGAVEEALGLEAGAEGEGQRRESL